MIIATQDYEEAVQRFDRFYSKNYKKISIWSKRNRIPDDTVHDSYLILRDRISKVGFEGNTFLTYIKLSIKNLHINNLKRDSKKYWVDCFSSDWQTTVEEILADQDDVNSDNLLYQNQLMEISRALFKYLEPRYDSEYMFVFKTYYLLETKFTYDKLTQTCGVGKNRCTKIITTMKADLRENLMNYIKLNTDVE